MTTLYKTNRHLFMKLRAKRPVPEYETIEFLAPYIISKKVNGEWVHDTVYSDKMFKVVVKK